MRRKIEKVPLLDSIMEALISIGQVCSLLSFVKENEMWTQNKNN